MEFSRQEMVSAPLTLALNREHQPQALLDDRLMDPANVPHLVSLGLGERLEGGGVHRDVAALVEVGDPLAEVGTGLLVVGQLAPLHEDKGKEFPNFVLQNFWLKSLSRELRHLLNKNLINLALISFYINLQNDILALDRIQYVSHHDRL